MLSAKLSSIARDNGLAKVMQTNDFTRLYAALTIAAIQCPEITSDQVWSILDEYAPIFAKEHSPNALGAAFRSAAINGLITQTSRFRKSSRVSAHRRNVQIWRSLLYTGVAA